MSGGTFEYDQYRISMIADTIQSELDKQGQEKPEDECWGDDKLYEVYSEETQAEFRKAIRYLRIAAIYAQRIDWFLSGDDGEENFHKQLKEDLNAL